MRCVFQCVYSNKILKNHLWLSTYLVCQHTTAKYYTIALYGKFYEHFKNKFIEEHIWLGKPSAYLALKLSAFSFGFSYFQSDIQNTRFPKSMYQSVCTQSLAGNDIIAVCW